MLDLGFLPDIERILAMVPDKRQTMLFSATMPGPIVTLSRSFMTQPTHIRAHGNDEGSTVPQTTQFIYRAHNLDKPELLSRVLQSRDRGLVMVFCRTKRTAQKVADELVDRGFAAAAVHGDLGQGAREQALRAFRSGKVDVLVATDVAARGIDVTGVSHVVNYQCPEDEKTYVHRIGRTGRAGSTGVAVTLVDWDDIPRWQLINKALDLGFADPPETYSTSPWVYTDLDVPTTATGRLPRSQRTREGLEAETLEDLGETGKRNRPAAPAGRRAVTPAGAATPAARRAAAPASAPARPTGSGKSRPRRRTRGTGTALGRGRERAGVRRVVVLAAVLGGRREPSRAAVVVAGAPTAAVAAPSPPPSTSRAAARPPAAAGARLGCGHRRAAGRRDPALAGFGRRGDARARPPRRPTSPRGRRPAPSPTAWSADGDAAGGHGGAERPGAGRVARTGCARSTRSPATEAWHYTRSNARMCGLTVTNGVAVAVFATADRCDEAVALRAGTGVRAWTRSILLRGDATLTSTDRIVLASNPTGHRDARPDRRQHPLAVRRTGRLPVARRGRRQPGRGGAAALRRRRGRAAAAVRRVQRRPALDPGRPADRRRRAAAARRRPPADAARGRRGAGLRAGGRHACWPGCRCPARPPTCRSAPPARSPSSARTGS